MSHFVKMFSPRFAPKVEDGSKRQTIRPTPKRMPKPGDTISCREWTGKPYRSKQRMLCAGKIVEVLPVEIGMNCIFINRNNSATPTEIFNFNKPRAFNAFARADGFKNAADMLTWFRETHGLPFNGILIGWEVKPAPECSSDPNHCPENEGHGCACGRGNCTPTVRQACRLT